MIEILKWYLLIVVFGAISFPVAFWFFKSLPDKGYSLTKPFGILLVGYVYWLLGYAKILPVSVGGAVTAALILAMVSLLTFRKYREDINAWWKANKSLIVFQELLFLAAFVFFVAFRAANPDISATEKPMELAFINSILRSPSFPPNDPWLSGYSISYYYFGYVLVAMMAQLSGVVSAIGYNLAGSSWFAMVSIGSFGILYNLLTASEIGSRKSRKFWSFLAPMLVLIAGNFFIIFQMFYASGAGMSAGQDGVVQSSFWNWFNHRALPVPKVIPEGWKPGYPGWDWWPASRTLSDTGLSGNQIEIIDEFPMFSAILMDLHPHVLNLPFVLIAISICLNLILTKRGAFLRQTRSSRWYLDPLYWLTALTLGSLAFMNTWDFPIYLGMLGLVVLWRESIPNLGWDAIWKMIQVGFAVGIGSFLLYLPFFLGFSTGAGGILPSLNYITRGVYFWTHFGLFLIPLIGLLIVLNSGKGSLPRFARGLALTVLVFLILFVIMTLVGMLFVIASQALSAGGSASGFMTRVAEGLGGYFGSQGLSDFLTRGMEREFVFAILGRRLTEPGTWITLILMGSFAIAAWQRMQIQPINDKGEVEMTQQNKSHGFVLVLITVGLILTTFVEFFYLRDGFGNRMNSIFKFYYQVWIVWGIGAAFAFIKLIHTKSWWVSLIFVPLTVAGFVLAMMYPFQMIPVRSGYPGRSITELRIDGNAYLGPERMEAINWLQSAPYGILAEAEGAQYSEDSTYSVRTGLPTILGWTGHEVQWRSDTAMLGPRAADLKLLYETPDWATAKSILDRFNVRYIVLSQTERNKYQVNDLKFDQNLPAVISNASVKIYEYSGIDKHANE